MASESRGAMRKSVDVIDSINFLSIKELQVAIEDERQSQKLIKLENDLIEKYLSQNYTQSMSNMSAVLDESERQQSLKSRGSVSGTFSLRTSSSATSSHVTSYDSIESRTSQRACFTFRMDLVQKSIDQKEIELERQLQAWKTKRRDIQQHLEQLEILDGWINEIIERYDKSSSSAQNPVTGRYEGDKIIKTIESSLRELDLKTDKARLHLNFLRVRLCKVNNQLAEKGELGERICPVDFTILRISQAEALKKLELRNLELLAVKKIAAETLFSVGLQKKFLVKQFKDIEATKLKIAHAQKKIAEFIRLRQQVFHEQQKAYKDLCKVRHMQKNYNTPHVAEYIDKQYELQEFNKQIKIWNRRKQLVHVQLQGARIHLKKVTGNAKLQQMKAKPFYFENINNYLRNMERDLAGLESKID